MIKSFRHKGLERFFQEGSRAGIQPAHAKRLNLILTVLDSAEFPAEMDVPGWDWHALKGSLVGYWAVKVNGQWRVVYAFDGADAVLVDYLDYH